MNVCWCILDISIFQGVEPTAFAPTVHLRRGRNTCWLSARLLCLVVSPSEHWTLLGLEPRAGPQSQGEWRRYRSTSPHLPSHPPKASSWLIVACSCLVDWYVFGIVIIMIIHCCWSHPCRDWNQCCCSESTFTNDHSPIIVRPAIQPSSQPSSNHSITQSYNFWVAYSH